MPRAGWKKPVSDRRLSDLVSVGVLTRVFPPDLVDEVIAQAGRTDGVFPFSQTPDYAAFEVSLSNLSSYSCGVR